MEKAECEGKRQSQNNIIGQRNRVVGIVEYVIKAIWKSTESIAGVSDNIWTITSKNGR